MNKQLIFRCVFIIMVAVTAFTGCEKDDGSPAPYAGDDPSQKRNMSNIQVQQGSYRPRITWIGGYACVVGVNKDSVAALDSTLIWLIHTNGNNIHYPVTFGTLPQGAEDLTSAYGGTKLDSLDEDFKYTYWVVKEEIWNQISQQTGKIIQVDSLVSTITPEADTLNVPSSGAVTKVQSIDVFVNVMNIQTYGRLADLTVIPTNNTNNPIITWTIKESGVTDSSVSAIGLVEGQQYQEAFVKWAAWSQVEVNGQPVYGRHNIISDPVVIGQALSGTRLFNQYTLGGLERNKDYLVWIANDIWNQTTRSRAASGYAWVTFRTW